MRSSEFEIMTQTSFVTSQIRINIKVPCANVFSAKYNLSIMINRIYDFIAMQAVQYLQRKYPSLKV